MSLEAQPSLLFGCLAPEPEVPGPPIQDGVGKARTPLDSQDDFECEVAPPDLSPAILSLADGVRSTLAGNTSADCKLIADMGKHTQGTRKKDRSGVDSANHKSVKIESAKVSLVGFWEFDGNHDICVICRNKLVDPCIPCQTTEISLEDRRIRKCTISWGACKHVYHTHCISRWAEERNTCPFDQGPWHETLREFAIFTEPRVGASDSPDLGMSLEGDSESDIDMGSDDQWDLGDPN